MKSYVHFDGLAIQYANGRPTYSSELIKYLCTLCNISPKSHIADVGSGTGILTKQLLETGAIVYGIEPNSDMRSMAERLLSHYDNFFSINADSSNTTLKNNHINLITAAQSFHWFNTTLFKEECHRILADNGKLALIWNIRDIADEINAACYKVYKEHCPSFLGFNGGIKKDDERIKIVYDNHYDYVEFDNTIEYDKLTFLNRCLSSSYVSRDNNIAYIDLQKKFEEIFHTYEKNNTLEIKYKSVCYIGTM